MDFAVFSPVAVLLYEYTPSRARWPSGYRERHRDRVKKVAPHYLRFFSKTESDLTMGSFLTFHVDSRTCSTTVLTSAAVHPVR